MIRIRHWVRERRIDPTATRRRGWTAYDVVHPEGRIVTHGVHADRLNTFGARLGQVSGRKDWPVRLLAPTHMTAIPADLTRQSAQLGTNPAG